MNEYRQGEHICVLYETEEEQLAVASEYMADGLRHGERGLYVAASRPHLERFRTALRGRGVDPDRAVASHALVEATHAEAHLVDGYFDSERMLGKLNDAVETALNDGFTGLRACGDMSWLLLEPPGLEQVVEYEALLNPFFHGLRACGMCLYDRKRVPGSLLDHALATHSSVVAGGTPKANPFYKPPAIAATRTAHAEDLHWKMRELRRR